MIADQNHSSDSIHSEQEVIRRTENIAKLLELNEQNIEVYKVLFRQIWELEKQLENYHFKYIKLKRRVNSLKAEIEDPNECADMETVIDLIHKIVFSIIAKKGPKGAMHKKGSSYLSKSSEEEFDSVKTIIIRENEAILHK